MKLNQIKCIVSALLCTLILCACSSGGTGDSPAQTTGTQPTVPSAAEATVPVTAPPQTDPVQTEPVQTVPPQTEPAETAPASAVPYTTALDAAVSIYRGPGYDNSFVRAVGKDGIYTIVEEDYDEDGSLWGRLKSGLGWVDLTNAHLASKAPILAFFADDDLLSGNYHECIVDDTEYTVKIVFRANEVLKDVRFTSLQYAGTSYEAVQTLYTLDTLAPEESLVAGVVFYGDLTTYGISFTDSSGGERHYAVYVSGRNGALVLSEYTPA